MLNNKKFYLIIFTILTFTISNTKIEAKLTYNYITKIAKHYEIIGDKKILKLSSEYRYDSKGRLFKVKNMEANGDVYKEFKFTYDKKGKVKNVFSFKNTGEIQAKKNLSYLATGVLKNTIIHKNNYFYSKGIPVFDKAGNIIKMKERDYAGRSYIKEEFGWDKRGNKTLEIQYNSDLSIHSKERFKYDKKNRLIERKEYDLDGSVFKRDKFVYRNGKLREKFTYDNSGKLIEKEEIKYSKKGYPKKLLKYDILLGHSILMEVIDYSYKKRG